MTKKDLHCLPAITTIRIPIERYFDVCLRSIELVSDVLQLFEKRVILELATSQKEISVSEEKILIV